MRNGATGDRATVWTAIAREGVREVGCACIQERLADGAGNNYPQCW